MPQRQPATVDTDLLLDLFSRHVRFSRERVLSARTWPNAPGAVVETDCRLLSIRLDPDYLLIGRADWVDALVVVERADLIGPGRPETDVIAVVDGQGLLLNDPAVVADLGRRLRTDLTPPAYAEILVAFHPWTVAWQEVVGPPAVGEDPDDDLLTLEFSATSRYTPAPGCDVYRWRVDVPSDGVARWRRVLIAERLPVEALPREA